MLFNLFLSQFSAILIREFISEVRLKIYYIENVSKLVKYSI